MNNIVPYHNNATIPHPPDGRKLEAALLGELFTCYHAEHRDNFWRCVTPQMFRFGDHAIIARVAYDLYCEGVPVDVTNVNMRIRKRYLHSNDIQLTASNLFLSYTSQIDGKKVQALRDLHVRHELWELALRLLGASCDETTPVAETMNTVSAEVSVVETSVAIAKRNIYTTTDLLKLAADEQQKRIDGNTITRGLTTGLQQLDKFVRFEAGELIVIAARPGMGKTVLKLVIAMNVAHTHEQPVYMYELEMTAAQTADRLLAAGIGIPLHSVKYGYDEHERELAAIQTPKIQRLQLYVEDVSEGTPNHLRAAIRNAVRRYGICMATIDYLTQLTIPEERYGSRARSVGEVAKMLKSLAKELAIPIVLLAQLNRAVDDRPKHVPMLSDLRDSGEIEEAADKVLMLRREDRYHEGEDKYTPSNTVDIYIEKNRQGPTGWCECRWVGEQVWMENLYTEQSEVPF